MKEIKAGMLAVSLAGHDKGVLYYIVKADEDTLWLSDGRLKPLEAPKKKNVKHIQAISHIPSELIPAEPITNESVKRMIRLYRSLGGLECQKQMLLK